MGFIAGLLAGAAGAMGLGGGSVLLIYLTLIAGIPQLEAQGINLVFFLPCALIALLFHMKGGLLKRRTLPCVVTGLIGAAAGAFLAGSMGDALLRKCFAVLLLILGAREIFSRSEKPNTEDSKAADQNQTQNPASSDPFEQADHSK